MTNPPAPGRPMDDLLFGAVHLHSMRTRGQAAVCITLEYRDGSRTTLPVPARAAPEVPPPAAPAAAWPAPDGWCFRPGEAAFNGTRFRLAGKLLGILRELAARPGEPVAADRLKAAVWHEEPDYVEDANLHGHVSQLRKRLRDALGLPADHNPITQADGAYRLGVY